MRRTLTSLLLSLAFTTIPVSGHAQDKQSPAAAADLSHDVPYLQEAALPAYPPIGRAASVTGKVIVAVTISGGKVTNTDVKSGARLLVGGTIANLMTWRFADDVNGTFTVTYTYAISGDETDGLMNSKVEMLPSLDVNVTSRPIKLIPMYGAGSAKSKM